MDRKRDTSPISSAQVSAVMGPTPGTVLRPLSSRPGADLAGENSPERIRFSGTLRSCPGSAAATAVYFHGSLGCWQVAHGSNPPCAAAVCYGSRPFPSTDPRSGSSSEPSGAPTGGDSARYGADPVS